MSTEKIVQKNSQKKSKSTEPKNKSTNKDIDIEEDDLTGETLITKFMDEDDEDNEKKKKSSKKEISIVGFSPAIGERPISEYIFADASSYNFKTWKNFFPDKKVKLRSLIFNPAWNDFFDSVERKPYFKTMEKIFSEYLSNKETIVPYPELVFNAFNVLSPKKIKVIFIGQDPYPGMVTVNNKAVPHAMGFSFSAPLNSPKPESLKNIYNNLLQYNNIKNIPDTGCLAMWILQGCFMVNASFTTFHTKRNAHKETWKYFTNDLISYINTNLENVVFVVWGRDAYELCKNVDPYRHYIITSSHPSPLAFTKTFEGFVYGPVKSEANRKRVTYPAFQTTNHFGKINEYLKSVNKNEIIWDMFDF